MSIYIGYNIHNYTKQIVNVIPKYFGDSVYTKVDSNEWNSAISVIQIKYPGNPAIKNLKRNFQNGFIIDPQLPKVNSAKILILIWNQIKDNDVLCKHFSETLKQIGNTCIQGVSHRLIIDYIALYNDIIEQVLLKYFDAKLRHKIFNYI